MKALIAMVREGMTEREQQEASEWIYAGLAEISINRDCDENEEKTP